MIETSGRHLLELINDVLDVARIEADRFEIEQVEVDLAAVARDVAKVVAETAAAKGLRLIVDIDDAALVVGDPRRLRQVAFNLLSNATKFTDTGGRVVLRLEVIDDHVILTVADTGIGIPAGRLPLLFQPFERVDSSLSRAHDGTGLGLVLTRRLVELHGGSIEVASIEGEGTTFTVRVPSMAAAPRP